MIAFNCQPLTSVLAKPVAPLKSALPEPKGNSYVLLKLKRFRTSNADNP